MERRKWSRWMMVVLLQVAWLNENVPRAEASGGCTDLNFKPFGLAMKKLGRSCSGHGVCSRRNDSCTCDEGWTGRSDFVSSEGFDCHIHEPTIKALWSICLVISLVLQAQSLPKVIARVRRQRRRKTSAGELFRNRGLMAVLTHSLICFPSVVSAALIRIANDQERVGITKPLTFLFVLGKIGFYVSVYFFQPEMLKTLFQGDRRDSESAKKLLMQSQSFAKYNMVVSIGLGFLAFVPIRENGFGTNSLVAFNAYCAGMAASLLFYGMQSSFIKQKGIRVLDDMAYLLPSNQSTIESVKLRVVSGQVLAVRQATVQGLAFMIYFLLPFMYNKHDYFFPISWIAFALIGKKMAFTVTEGVEFSDRADFGTNLLDTKPNLPKTSAERPIANDTKAKFFAMFGSVRKFPEPNSPGKDRDRV